MGTPRILPCVHLLYMWTLVADLNKALSPLSHGGWKACHGRCGCCQASQSHRNLKARLNFWRSSIPSPPSSIGAHTCFQLTMHLPPAISLSPAQRKRRLALSMSRRSFIGTLSAVSAKVGKADSTDRTKMRRPAMLSSLPFHPASLDLILSMMN